eukprot:TRINITY_DN32615_c0_g1_i1.p3 TRINITY_DN32615_c0_g1~~TRINITY_DN32615_c0_g1_i1.p3  ORF type:complete len:197 (+),score=75.30 TRINITY_DN32615_c0_g1_i1:850-1440(+)
MASQVPQLRQGWGPGLDPSRSEQDPLLESTSDDPWGELLAQSSGDFVYVPAATLERLRKIGESRMAEIAKLRKLVNDAPVVAKKTEELEAQLQEMEVARVVAENELELRRQEAAALQEEAAQLRRKRDKLADRAAEVQLRVEQLQRWLKPLGGDDKAKERAAAFQDKKEAQKRAEAAMLRAQAAKLQERAAALETT